MLNSKIGMTHGALVVGLAASLLSGSPARNRLPDGRYPTNLGSVVNSSAADVHPALSPDSLSLYFSSDRPGGTGGSDLWGARRASPSSPWQPPVPITPLNSDAAEFGPAFDPSGRWLFFGSERDGGCGGRDLWLSYRVNPKDDLAWKPPVNLGCGRLSYPGFDDGPTYFREGRTGLGVLFFISERPGGRGGRDVWMASHRNGGAFWAPVPVAELSSEAPDTRPVVRSDGLEFIVSSSRAGSVLSGARRAVISGYRRGRLRRLVVYAHESRGAQHQLH